MNIYIKKLKNYIHIFGTYLNNFFKNNDYNILKSYFILIIINLIYSLFYITWFKKEIIFSCIFNVLFYTINGLTILYIILYILLRFLLRNYKK
jgi:hypothetical protein